MTINKIKERKIMGEISFTSTYRIPLVEQGITKAKREALKEMSTKYQNSLFPKGNNGFVRISIRKRLDEKFEQNLKQLGFKVFQKFEKHNVPKTALEVNSTKLDLYINEELNKKNYRQYGKQMGK